MTRNYRKFYALLKRLPGADKESFVMQFTDNRTDSLHAMHNSEFQTMLAIMEGRTETVQSPKSAECDVWRKRLMAAIGGWLRAMNRQQNAGIIKAIACQAAKVDKRQFNSIPLERLRSLYNAFLKASKDMKAVEKLTAEEIDLLTLTN
ncbi:MAG: hypothetical protein LBV26_06770 [Bacteroidales bacterium]|jgi:hypothetical protein|nr:hypothetical protein [Bacteroidales bacterium]